MLVAAAALFVPKDGPLSVTLYRSWYPPDLTVVNGLFRVDGAMLGTGPECSYHARLTVVDSVGTRLVNNEWDGRCPAPVNGVPSGALETFQFAVKPATYTVEVVVTAAGPNGARLTSKAPLVSLLPGAVASDLILAKRAGWVDSTANVQWTITKGKLGIAAASEAVAEQENPTMAYYVELYPRGGTASGSLTGVIKRGDGRELARLPLQKFDGVTEARPLAGNMSLAGLAPGEYTLEALLDLGDTVIVRTHAFRMEGPSFGQVAVQPAEAGGGYFSSLTDKQVADLFDPVIGTLRKQSDRDLFQNLNADGKRRFLRQYFGVAGPAGAGNPPNALDLYLTRVQAVDQFEGRGGEPAWRTDRGRIFLTRGEPQSRVARPMPSSGASPFEIWQYTISPNYAYVFLDEVRSGSYRLIWTNDPNEVSLPDWDKRMGEEVLQEMLRLGIRPGS
jgi:GWxTD domain-containing protein